ncbi:IS1096%2C tnpA protein [Mycobacteroides abscessus]|nr:IS1096%2C tnpA protein [Mycobacteroides abscessus]
MSTSGGTPVAVTGTSPSSSISPLCVTGPVRLGCSTWSRVAQKRRFRTGWPSGRQDWRDGVDVVAMDGFSGFKTATAEELPEAATVMDPFHVVRLAGNALDECRRRVQLATCGHRGRKSDPLYTCRRTLHTGADLLTDRQRTRLAALFAADAHAEVEATWQMYQRTVAAYREPDRTKGRTMMAALITTLSTGVPQAADRTDHPGTDPEEACRRRAGLLRPPRHLQRAHRSDQRPPRTPARIRAGLPQPHQLHRPVTARDRRLPNSAPCTSAVKSPQRIFDAARASLVSVTEKRSGCQPRGSQSRISCAPSPIGVARGSYPPRTHAANSS